ncbi:MAG: 50S ribosomal protein L18 [Acidobacteria bacterium]|nr:MAG: 50S ribosomal protein L18 [Acidobacteriota bacterium]
MEHVTDKQTRRQRIKARIHKRVRGSPERPRLVVFKSDRHIYVQAVDDQKRHTLASASTRDPALKTSLPRGGTVAAAKIVGASIAEKLAGVEQVARAGGAPRPKRAGTGTMTSETR